MTEYLQEIGEGLASTKIARPFLGWLKIEAARRGVPMYELIEQLIARGGPRPWRKQPKPEATR